MGRRGRSLRRAVLAAALVGLVGVVGCDGAPPPPPPPLADPLPSLVQRLSAPDFAERERAHAELLVVAPARYADLEKARADAKDPEAQARLDSVLASPRVILRAAWLKAEADGKLDLALGERWFRLVDEEVEVGYVRLEAARDGGELVFTKEEYRSGTGRYHANFRTWCSPELVPLRFEAFLEIKDRRPTVEMKGTWEGGGIRAERAGRPELRLPWPAEGIPYEVFLNLAPLWARSGPPGREVAFADLLVDDERVAPYLARDEGPSGKGAGRRISFLQDLSDKAECTAVVGRFGELEALLWPNNHRAVRISADEGRKLRDRFSAPAPKP